MTIFLIYGSGKDSEKQSPVRLLLGLPGRFSLIKTVAMPFLGAVLSVLVLSSSSWAVTQVMSIRHWVSPHRTRLVFDLSTMGRFEYYKVNKNRSLVVEIPHGENKMKESSFQISNSPVREVRLRSKKRGILGVVVDLDSPLATEVFALKKYRDKPDRLVIDIFLKDSRKVWQKKVSQVHKSKREGKKIVVLDPGHGGEDPGAVGRLYREKDLALSIARKCFELLRKEESLQPVLTRNGDYYISLGERVRIAEDYRADLFVSIHANANYNRTRNGSSIYFLSHKGATDKATRLLARRENAADLLGGTSTAGDRTLNAILINMSQTSTINDSILMGNSLVDQFSRSIRKVKMERQLKSASFAVLKSPNIPSILFETAFISNPGEERLLGNNRFQWDLAKTLARAIIQYCGKVKEKPSWKTARPPQPPQAPRKSPGKLVHVVRRGDTVFKISRHYGIDMSRLKKTNNIGRTNRILVGQKLTIP